jgi:hypothetical protein
MNQVHEVFSPRNVSLLFCDQYFSERYFRDPVSADASGREASRVTVTIRTGELDEYLQVMRFGAYDGLQCQCARPMSSVFVLRAMLEDRANTLWHDGLRARFIPECGTPSQGDHSRVTGIESG